MPDQFGALVTFTVVPPAASTVNGAVMFSVPIVIDWPVAAPMLTAQLFVEVDPDPLRFNVPKLCPLPGEKPRNAVGAALTKDIVAEAQLTAAAFVVSHAELLLADIIVQVPEPQFNVEDSVFAVIAPVVTFGLLVAKSSVPAVTVMPDVAKVPVKPSSNSKTPAVPLNVRFPAMELCEGTKVIAVGEPRVPVVDV